jgi:hypothetical protein
MVSYGDSLMPKVDALEDQDLYFLVTYQARRLLAAQDPRFTRPYVAKLDTNVFEQVKFTETFTGVPTGKEGTKEGKGKGETVRKGRKGGRAGKGEVLSKPAWTFPVTRTKYDGKPVDVILFPAGGPFGIIKGSIRRAFHAMKKRQQQYDTLDLMKIHCQATIQTPQAVKSGNIVPLEYAIAGPAPAESQQEGYEPMLVMTPRIGQGGREIGRVPEFYDWFSGRTFQFIMELDSQAKITEEEVCAIFKSLNTLDNHGPAKRGDFILRDLVPLKLDTSERGVLAEGKWPFEIDPFKGQPVASVRKE